MPIQSKPGTASGIKLTGDRRPEIPQHPGRCPRGEEPAHGGQPGPLADPAPWLSPPCPVGGITLPMLACSHPHAPHPLKIPREEAPERLTMAPPTFVSFYNRNNSSMRGSAPNSSGIVNNAWVPGRQEDRKGAGLMMTGSHVWFCFVING